MQPLQRGSGCPAESKGLARGHGPPVDGYERAMAANEVAGAGGDRLDEQRASREIAARTSECDEWLGQADDRQRTRQWSPCS